MELKILDWIQALHNPVTDVLFVWITRLGNVGMIWILLAAVLLLRRKTRKTGDILGGVLVGLFAGWAGSRIAAKLLKCSPALARMCAPERPDGKEGRR